MLPYHIRHKIKNHPVVLTIPCLREGVTNTISVDVFSTTTTFPRMYLKKKKSRSLSSTKFKSENSSIQVTELQSTTLNANILIPKTEVGMVYVLLIPRGQQESSEQKSNPTFLMNTLLVLQTCCSTTVLAYFC
jgi:hypothetical protein